MDDSTQLSAQPLRCFECDELSTAEARGWRAYLIEDVHETLSGEPEILVYCARCSEREFPDS